MRQKQETNGRRMIDSQSVGERLKTFGCKTHVVISTQSSSFWRRRWSQRRRDAGANLPVSLPHHETDAYRIVRWRVVCKVTRRRVTVYWSTSVTTTLIRRNELWLYVCAVISRLSWQHEINRCSSSMDTSLTSGLLRQTIHQRTALPPCRA